MLLERKADSLLSCCPEHFTGHFQMREDGSVSPTNFDLQKRPMRQQVPIDYVENGSIYVFKTSVLRTTGSRLGGRITVYPMPAWRSFQIDEPVDYEIAEAMMRRLPRTPLSPSELADVQLLVTDFDGVLTDNRVWVAEDGRESVACCRSDGLRLRELARMGVECLVLSTETNPVVEARCRKLGLSFRQGLTDKRAALLEETARRGLEARQVAYLGNDLNDLVCLAEVGVPVAVADAYPDVVTAVRWVTRTAGGFGALREVTDALMAARTELANAGKAP
jgi:YrbI family 3-deoxy-D-manno-octulosonate 8-phosphate phosphatase